MHFKVNVVSIVAAITAAASAFGAAYTAANLDNLVTSGEWMAIIWAVVTAITATLFQASPKV